MDDLGASATSAPSDSANDAWIATSSHGGRELVSTAVYEWITVAGGHPIYGYPIEIGWSLSSCCLPADDLSAAARAPLDNCTTMSGGAPFYGYFEMLTRGSICTLAMTDTYGDGWNGFHFSGFGQAFTLTAGSFSTATFYAVQPPSPPPSPPSTPPWPPRAPPSEPPMLPASQGCGGGHGHLAATAAITISLLGAVIGCRRRQGPTASREQSGLQSSPMRMPGGRGPASAQHRPRSSCAVVSV